MKFDAEYDLVISDIQTSTLSDCGLKLAREHLCPIKITLDVEVMGSKQIRRGQIF